MTEMRLIYAVSDSTGDTAEQATNAALAQFGVDHGVQVRIFSEVRDEDSLREVLDRAEKHGAFIVYTLMEPGLRRRMARLTQERSVQAVDLLGSFIQKLSRYLDLSPLYLPGLGHATDDEYYRRIEAVEFAVYNDDGRLPENLIRADLILVGISRTSKTPLSNYIAHRGYKVANVPLIRGHPVPEQLEDVDSRRVFALVVDPAVLVHVRRARLNALGVDTDPSYGNLHYVREEMAWARRVFRDHPDWTVVDTTERAIEETAAEVLGIYRARFERAVHAKKDES